MKAPMIQSTGKKIPKKNIPCPFLSVIVLPLNAQMWTRASIVPSGTRPHIIQSG
jgi:hypothetical protein